MCSRCHPELRGAGYPAPVAQVLSQRRRLCSVYATCARRVVPQEFDEVGRLGKKSYGADREHPCL